MASGTTGTGSSTGTTGTDASTGTTGTATTTTTTTTGTATGTTGTTGTATGTTGPATGTGAADTQVAGQPLVEPVTAQVGQIEVSIVPTAAGLPASAPTNFFLVPFTGAQNPIASFANNVATLNYNTEVTMQELLTFYEQQFTAQGFTRVQNAVEERTGDQESVRVYQRANGNVILTVTRVEGGYRVTANLAGLNPQ